MSLEQIRDRFSIEDQEQRIKDNIRFEHCFDSKQKGLSDTEVLWELDCDLLWFSEYMARTTYKDGVVVCRALSTTILDALHHGAAFQGDKLYEGRDKIRVGHIFADWEEGTRLTPPFLVPDDSGQLLVLDGNHRIAAALICGATELPFIIKLTAELIVKSILSFKVVSRCEKEY